MKINPAATILYIVYLQEKTACASYPRSYSGERFLKFETDLNFLLIRRVQGT